MGGGGVVVLSSLADRGVRFARCLGLGWGISRSLLSSVLFVPSGKFTMLLSSSASLSWSCRFCCATFVLGLPRFLGGHTNLGGNTILVVLGRRLRLWSVKINLSSGGIGLFGVWKVGSHDLLGPGVIGLRGMFLFRGFCR